MKLSRFFALAALAAGSVFSTAPAQAYDYRDNYRDRQDLRYDYARVDRLRARIAADRYRLEEDRRCGRYRAAERDARDLARHQHELERQFRDIRHDRNERYGDRR